MKVSNYSLITSLSLMLSHNLVTLMANPTFNEYLGVNYVALIFVDVLRQKTNRMINVISLKGHALHAMPFTSSLSIKFFMPKCQNCKTLKANHVFSIFCQND